MDKSGWINLIIFLLLGAGFIPENTSAMNAPVTRAGVVLNASLAPATTTVPVTVSHFTDIGSLHLTLDYSSTILTYISASPNAALTGLTVTVTTPGRLVIDWSASGSGVTFPEETTLLNIVFSYNTSGQFSSLTWYDNGTSCQYTKYDGGAFTILNDQPAYSYYINGAITDHPAPTTLAPFITGAVPGQVSVPVKVIGFSDIGALTLRLQYDSDVLSYVGFTPNSQVPGSIEIGNNAGTGSLINLDILWFGTPFGLPDSSILLTLVFTYSHSSGTDYSDLAWIDNGPSCEYSDGQYHVLFDTPATDYYKNGLVCSRVSPSAWLPAITDATPGAHRIVPVQVDHFTNVGSFLLTFEYDPGVLSYAAFSPDAAFGAAMTVTNNPPANGKRTLSIAWQGSAPVSLPDGSALVTLDFSYASGTSALTWVTNDTVSCRFSDSTGNVLFDFPAINFYHDGTITSHPAPVTAAWYATPEAGQPVTIPVRVFRFNNIGFFSLTLDYDPEVLTYQQAELIPSLGGSFSAMNPGPGRINLTWSGTTVTLPDDTSLVNLTFLYNGGDTELAWSSADTSCRYAETPLSTALYDAPLSSFYVNGYVGSAPAAIWEGNFSTDWNTAANWNIRKVPGSHSNVTIPASAPGWPVFQGDFISGIHCKTIFCNINSRFTITGTLTIREE